MNIFVARVEVPDEADIVFEALREKIKQHREDTKLVDCEITHWGLFGGATGSQPGNHRQIMQFSYITLKKSVLYCSGCGLRFTLPCTIETVGDMVLALSEKKQS